MKAFLATHIKSISLLILLVASLATNAQVDTTRDVTGADSLKIYQPAQYDTSFVKEPAFDPVDTAQTHNPQKAALLAIIPGAGQIYNRKYWKVPIVYAALAGCAYSIDFNHVYYRDHLDAFYSQTDDDPDNDQLTQYSPAQLIELQDYYHRQRDLSIIITVAVYGLQMLDAYVDAHLFYYDISDDLTLQWEPRSFRTSLSPTPAYGLGLTFNLK